MPENTYSGIYKGEIKIKFEKKIVSIPVKLKVFDFALSEETHTRTAYGVSLNTNYHNLKDKEDILKTWDLYMEFVRKHRISPYEPMDFHPIKQDIDCKTGEVKLDFSDFDKAGEKYLDKFKFNGFRWGLPGEICGYKIFTPEYNEFFKKIQGKIIEHLKEKGWLEKAYCYWIDEPPPDKWDYVKKGMNLLKMSCPGLKRLLTINTTFAPAISFYGDVDIWVPIFHFYHPKRAKLRQKKGEEVWWYVCCEPRAPFPNNFIDHPAINHRIRFWMMQKFGVDGDLYWSITYWAQNPWETTMSYNVSDGYKFGNGDGRLLYPPSRKRVDVPLISPPVSSIRFEMIREGLEDKEYLFILEQEIKRLKEKDSKKYDKYIKKGEEALNLVDDLVTDLTTYEKDPKKLYIVREKIAEVIEELRKIE